MNKKVFLFLLAVMMGLSAAAFSSPYEGGSGEAIVTIVAGDIATMHRTGTMVPYGANVQASGGALDLVRDSMVPIPKPVTVNVAVVRGELVVWAFIDSPGQSSIDVRIWWSVK